jgi:formylglycine-generating enzyme required for sulfatase activity
MDMTEVSNQQFVAYLNGLGDAVQIRNGDLVVYDGKVIYDLSCYNCKNWWEERIVWNGVQFSVVAGYEEHPVAMVSWHGADGYCTNVGGRLPTEAQWEYAARGATGNLYPWGNDFGCARGNFDDETAFDDFVIPGGMGCDGYDTTAPVGSFPVGASWAGVLDLSGNVWEWTADWYSDYSAARQDNPTGQVTGDLKVLRGGGWSNSVMLSLRGAYRYREDPFVRTAGFGFRCVVVPGD